MSSSNNSFGISYVDHSAHPVSWDLPPSTEVLSPENIVPLETSVGGVPQRMVCGFGEAAIVYISAPCWVTVYSWASSTIRRSNDSPNPPASERVRKTMFPPFVSMICSSPNCFVDLKDFSGGSSSFFFLPNSTYPADVRISDSLTNALCDVGVR